MLKFLLAATSIIWTGSLAEAACYKNHLTEAMELNLRRAPLYSNLTQGRSEVVSNRLIELERKLLKLNKWINIDRIAQEYEKAGVGVVCETYISMSQTPEFRPQFPEGPVLGTIPYDVKSLRIRKKLYEAFFSGSDAKMYNTTVALIEELEKEPRVNCLTRHFLESIARTTLLTQSHTQQARKKGLISPRYIHRLMVKGHILQFNEALVIDEIAKPLQMQGVPIICRDVPHIPYKNLN